MDLQSDTSIAAHFGLESLYEVPHLSEAELIRKIHGITGKDLQRVCRQYLVEPYQVTSVVG
jgi:predicted Zn-dependent peptidase